MRSFVEDGTLVGLVEFGERPRALVKDVPRMEREHCRVGFGFRRQSVEVEFIKSVASVLGEHCELLALEWL